MSKILVTGANGQVGSELQELAKLYKDWTFVFTDVQDLDITNPQLVEHFFDEHQFDFCLNCAAYTAVDKAESEQELTHKINVIGVENLAKACKKNKASLLQISTDYVYHNNEQNSPFKEDDATSPRGVYAATKLEGDLAALKLNNKSIVIRTSWVYSSFGHNFVKTMLRLGEKLDSLRIIFDQIGSPTYAKDLAEAMLNIVQQISENKVSADKAHGVYHYSNEGVLSWYDFAMAIFDIKNIDCNVSPIETKDYPTPAQRPPFSLLNKAKIKEQFGLEIPYWRDSLKQCLDLL